MIHIGGIVKPAAVFVLEAYVPHSLLDMLIYQQFSKRSLLWKLFRKDASHIANEHPC